MTSSGGARRTRSGGDEAAPSALDESRRAHRAADVGGRAAGAERANGRAARADLDADRALRRPARDFQPARDPRLFDNAGDARSRRSMPMPNKTCLREECVAGDRRAGGLRVSFETRSSDRKAALGGGGAGPSSRLPASISFRSSRPRSSTVERRRRDSRRIIGGSPMPSGSRRR